MTSTKQRIFYLTINPSAPKLNIELYVKPESIIIAPCYPGMYVVISRFMFITVHTLVIIYIK